MTDGLRDNFIENDAIGNSNSGTLNLFGRSSSPRRKKRKKTTRSVSHVRKRRKRSHVRQHKSRRHKGRGRGGIKYTKNGQPYKIMPNGKARFIKK